MKVELLPRPVVRQRKGGGLTSRVPNVSVLTHEERRQLWVAKEITPHGLATGVGRKRKSATKDCERAKRLLAAA